MCQYCCPGARQTPASCAWIFTASFQIRELVPESQAYMDLLAFERKLDQTIMRKRVDIQEALKRPMKVRCEICELCQGRKIILVVHGGNTFPVKVPLAEMLWNGSVGKQLGISMHRKVVEKILWLLPALASESL